MDLNSRVKTLAALAALALAGAAAPSGLLLREQAWTAVGETSAHDLTHAPAECLAERTLQTEIGRALFRSPTLLGGPAARAGISCDACHSNGRVNARFLLPELTDRAGHADVTSEWSSNARGDGVLNPLPIPDLADVAARTALGHAREPSLQTFVRNVVVEEFQGEPPPAAAFDGLIAYLRALRSDACPLGETAVTLPSVAEDVRRAVAAAEATDSATASLLLLAAQDRIGRIVERLPRDRFSSERQAFETLARDLGRMRNTHPFIPAVVGDLGPGWRVEFDAAVGRAETREHQTYFNEAVLRQALER